MNEGLGELRVSKTLFMKQFARLLEETVPDVDRYQDIAMEKKLLGKQ